MRVFHILLAIAGEAVLLAGSAWGAAPMGLAERIELQRKLERVHWDHRTWPDGSQEAKPPLEAVLPDDVLKTRVEDALRLSAALELRWGRPLTATDLQGELDRILRDSAAPDVLGELLAALDGDPRLAAECLARPLLAERFARQSFATDPGIHAEVAARAHAEAARLRWPADLIETGRAYRVVLTRIVNGGLRGSGSAETDDWLQLDPGAFDEMREQLRHDLGRLEAGTVGPLVEREDRFVLQALLESSEDRLEVATMTWPKRDFEDWWSEVREQYPARVAETAAAYHLAAPPSPNGTPNTWSAVGAAGSPPGIRGNHTAIWTGTEMIVWGGQDTQGIYYGGSRWVPATNSWTAMTNTGHPDARAYHTAIWSGSNMVVWGGWNGSEIATGGRYNPTTNTWESVATTGAPSARRYHGAAYLSSGWMVVWGGWNGSNYLGDGKRYSPGSDLWSTMSSTGAPSPRSNHIAVVSDTEGTTFFVWGGQDASGVLGDGAKYKPAQNSWYAVATSGAPSARLGHSAVLARTTQQQDRYVLIWGGYNGSNTVTSGAGYYSYWNEWRTMTASGAPAGRQGHTAVWADDTMMIWGGFTGATLRNSGSVFNSYNNVWKPITTTGAPTARKAHTAIWRPESTTASNGQMVVWGGWDGAYVATGGIYEEPTDFIVSPNKDTVVSVPLATEDNAFRVHVLSRGDFASAVTLSCSGFPGICQLSTNPVTPTQNGSGYSDITLSVGSGGTGTYPFTVVGTNGGTTRSYPMELILQDYGFSCSPAAVTAQPGGQATTTCTVSSANGFDDPVDLECSLYTCGFTPNPVTPPADGTATTQLTVTAGLTPGTFQVEIGAFFHSTHRLFNLELRVNDSGPIFADGFETGNTTRWSTTVG